MLNPSLFDHPRRSLVTPSQGSVWKVKQAQPPSDTLAVKLVFRIKEDKTTPARVRSIWQEFKWVSRRPRKGRGNEDQGRGAFRMRSAERLNSSLLHLSLYTIRPTIRSSLYRVIRAFKANPHPNVIHFHHL